MPTEFYFKFSTDILAEKLQSHFFTVTETLNSEKSDSEQCYSESESATAHYSNSTVFQHSLQPECSPVHISNRQQTEFT